MSLEKISVLLAGSEPDLNQNLKEIIENSGGINIVGSSDSKKRILDLAKELLPEVIVVDLGFAGDGLRASQQLLKISPKSKIIVLSVYDYIGRVDIQTLPEDGQSALDSIQWLSKNSKPAELLELISHNDERSKKRRLQ